MNISKTFRNYKMSDKNHAAIQEYPSIAIAHHSKMSEVPQLQLARLPIPPMSGFGSSFCAQSDTVKVAVAVSVPEVVFQRSKGR